MNLELPESQKGPLGTGPYVTRLQARWTQAAVRGALFLCAFISVFTTAGIVLVLLRETLGFFRHVPVLQFLTGTTWTPLFDPPSFGVLPLVCGTFLVAAGAALIALPLGLGSAIFMSEYASPAFASFVKPILEVLAGVPTIVYGYFALATVTPFLRSVLPADHAPQVFNAASAAIVVGIMILPMVSSLCDDALRAVPRSLRDAAYALGATRLEVSVRIVLPAALSGVLASFVLAVSRAVGETMAVSLAAGSTPKLTLNPLESIQTLTAYIVQVSLGDTPAGTVEYQSIFAVGSLLFLITLAMNGIAQRILKRFREAYD